MWSSSCGGPTPLLSLPVLAPGVNQLTSHKPSFIILAMRRAIVFEDRVYVLGGFDGTSRLRSVECFTPGPPGSRPRWHQVGSFEVNSPGRHLAVKVADMLEPRSNFSVAILNGRLFVMGGHRQDIKSWDIVILMVKINLACRGLAGRPEVCNLVDVYCPSSNKFVPILSFGQDVKMARS